MKIQTLIEATEDGYRAAILEDGVAVAFKVLSNSGDMTGPLYLARVKKVDAKMNAAFLDLGDGNEAFLPFRQAKALKSKLTTSISNLLHEGEKILVKITAPATEHGKLPLATANPMIAGRYALTGHLPGKGLVAKAITDEEKRAAFSTLLEDTHNGDALIIRSAAAVADEALVRDEIAKQQALWQELESGDAAPGVVLPALDPLEQILRDFAPADVDEVLVEGKPAFLKAQKMADQKWPDLKGKINAFEEKGIMDAYGVEERLEDVREGRSALPSGGYITIEDTRAMTVIDVNSGQGRKGGAPSAMHLVTNLEAANVIAREVRFQNLFGLITIDFIDMKKPEDRDKVVQALKEALTRDTMATEITGINRFGLLTIKRARRGQTLKTVMGEGT